jgi:DNA-binding LytR/AlgR family response regulator
VKEGELYWLNCPNSDLRQHQNIREEGFAAAGAGGMTNMMPGKDTLQMTRAAAAEPDELESRRRLTAVQDTMDFGRRSSGKTGIGSLSDNVDSQPESASEELPLPERPARMLAMGRSARIAIKAKGRIFFINAADVIAVEAKGNYVLLLHTSSSYILRESISTMEEKLNLHGFVRIHRSVLVNAALVEEIHPRSTGEYGLRMRGGREFTVTRTYKQNLQVLAQLWIGMEGFAAE